jgi:hypothetical protein
VLEANAISLQRGSIWKIPPKGLGDISSESLVREKPFLSPYWFYFSPIVLFSLNYVYVLQKPWDIF